MPTIDKTGNVYGRLRVLAMSHRDTNNSYWICLCECGNKKIIVGASLVTGKTRSCGCLRKECVSAIGRAYSTTHGMRNTVEYRTWRGIKERCLNPNYHGYANYGGRGIMICPEWKDSFETFFKDMGHRPSRQHSIERLDNGRGYEKGNCAWALPKQQCRNKRNNVLHVALGRSYILPEWAEKLGIPLYSLKNALYHKGISVEQFIAEKGYSGRVF